MAQRRDFEDGLVKIEDAGEEVFHCQVQWLRALRNLWAIMRQDQAMNDLREAKDMIAEMEREEE